MVFSVLAAGSGVLHAQTAAAPAWGNGSPDDPYRIATLENLYWLAAADQVVPEPSRAARSSAHYIQTANINAAKTRFWFDGKGWKPVFNFTGSYDGQGFTIDSLFIHDPDGSNIGLFGNTYGAEIRNLGLLNADIRGYQYVGALLGLACGYHNSNTHTLISRCYASGKVAGQMDTGGLIGFNDEGIVTDCFSRTETVSQYGPVGGLVGNNHREISRCYSSGTVRILDGTDVHGLIGNMSGLVQASFWDIESSGQPDTPEWEQAAYGISNAEMKNALTFIYANWDLDKVWHLRSSLNLGYPALRQQGMPGACTLRFETEVPESIGFDPLTDTLRVTGSFFDWTEPGGDPEQKLLYHADSGLWLAEIQIDPGLYTYKYYFHEGWSAPEWEGEPLRLLDLRGDTLIRDTWGLLNGEPVSVRDTEPPQHFSIGSCYPNPFNPYTLLPLELGADADVDVRLYNISGHQVREIYSGHLSAGSHALRIDGAKLSTGIYFVRIHVGVYRNTPQVQKIALMK